MNDQHNKLMKVKYASPGIRDLVPGRTGTMELTDGTVVNYGVIRIERNALVHYSGKGLRMMWKQEMDEKEQAEASALQALLKEPDGEQHLIAQGYIAVTEFARIAKLVS